MFKLEDFEAYTKHDYIGVFDKLYHIEDDLTDEQEIQLGEWLSTNCTRNFIMSKKTNSIFAGGCANNESAWLNRHNAGPFDVIREYYIKLYNSDVTLFELVWLT
jgi:hypothetical protein